MRWLVTVLLVKLLVATQPMKPVEPLELLKH